MSHNRYHLSQFSRLTPCSLVSVNVPEDNSLSWTRKQHVLAKRWYLPARLHGAITQKTHPRGNFKSHTKVLFTLKIEAVYSSETWISTYHPIQCFNSEHHNTIITAMKASNLIQFFLKCLSGHVMIWVASLTEEKSCRFNKIPVRWFRFRFCWK